MTFKTMLLAASFVSISAVSAQADTPTFTARDAAYTITFSGGLDTAFTKYDVTATLPAGGPDDGTDLLPIGVSYKTGFQDATFSTTGSVSTTFAPPAAGATLALGKILNGGDGGTWGFSYATPNGPDFASSWTMSTTANGRNVLAFGGASSQHFEGCGNGFVDLGGAFTCEVSIQGDHPEGTAPGDAYITNLSSEFSIASNFVYDADTNTTLLAIGERSYDGVGPDLAFNIVETSVPEPATWTMMLLGFGGLGVAVRSRRKMAVTVA